MKVKVKLPPGARIDRDYLEHALRAALGGAGSVWTLNEIPALAQLEESLYCLGRADIQSAWEATAELLGLPVGVGLSKSAGRLQLAETDHLTDRVRAAFFGEG